MSNTLPPFSFSAVSVGQVVYLIPKEAKGVIPALVVEEITRKTIAGVSTSLMVKLPTQQKPVRLDPDSAEIFTELADVQKVLIDRATIKIKEMLEDVREISLSFQDEPVNDIEQVNVTLPDGSKGRYSLPKVS